MNFFKRKKKKKEVESKKNTEVISKLDLLKYQLNSTNLNIQKNLHQLTKYFNKIPIMYAIIDYNSTLVRLNTSMISIISCCVSDCIGSSLLEFIHPDDLKIFDNFKKSLMIGGEEDEVIFRTLSEDGTVTYVKWGGVNCEEDQVIILFGQDITHEIDLSDKLRTFLNYKDLIFNTYPGAIISTNLKGKIKEFNRSAEQDTGYEKSMIVGKHIFEIFPDKHLFDEDIIGNIHKTNLRKKSGEMVNSFILLLPLLDDKNRLIGYFGIWHGLDYLNYIKSIIT